jgi:hypothetical protein
MHAFSPMHAPHYPYWLSPSIRSFPSHRSASLQFYPPDHYSQLASSGLTAHSQFCDLKGLEATMAADSGQMDMEAFQRLSDNYQPDVEVSIIRVDMCSVAADIARDR